MSGTAFVSGGSGFLGTYLTRELLEAGCTRVYILMRGESEGACTRRLQSLWHCKPILTIMALATKVARVCNDRFGA